MLRPERILPLSDRLSPNELQVSIESNLVSANRMVLEVVKAAELVLNKVVVEDASLHLHIIHFFVIVLVATACYNFEEEEERQSGEKEERQLQKVDDQVVVQTSNAMVFYPQHQVQGPLLLLLPNVVNVGAHDDC